MKTVNELKAAGALYIENIINGFDENNYHKIHMSAAKALDFFYEMWIDQQKSDLYVDFYYFYLDNEAKEKVRSYLTEEEIQYLNGFERNKEEIIFDMDETLLGIIVKLNEKEILFSTIYNLKDKVTWWGNYEQTYVRFEDGKRG